MVIEDVFKRYKERKEGGENPKIYVALRKETRARRYWNGYVMEGGELVKMFDSYYCDRGYKGAYDAVYTLTKDEYVKYEEL